MGAIELFYAAYGALLALAFAKILAGAARLISHRETIRIDWATPLLMLLLLSDLASFITNAWKQLGTADTTDQGISWIRSSSSSASTACCWASRSPSWSAASRGCCTSARRCGSAR